MMEKSITSLDDIESIDDLFVNTSQQSIQQQILTELVNFDENLEAKTELHHPKEWSIYSVLEEDAKNNKYLKKTHNLFSKFRKNSFIFMISNKRMGRIELKEVLKSNNLLPESEQQKNLLQPFNK